MSDLNKVIVIGRLTKEPETFYTSQGKPVTKLSIAINKKFGENETVSFFDVTTFGKTAEYANKYLKKGMKISVDGELQQTRWQDKQTGQQRSKVDIICNQIGNLSPKPTGQPEQPGALDFNDPYANEPIDEGMDAAFNKGVNIDPFA